MDGAQRHEMQPGRPRRGYDPTAGFTDMQWYMYHQRNVAYFAAFSDADFDTARIVRTARALLERAPQFALGYRGAGAPITDAVLAQLGRIETVESFEGLPDRWLGIEGGQWVYDDPDLPLFRLRIARRADGPDAAGRRSFLLVHVAHPLTEGSDSALLARSQAAGHVPAAEKPSAVPARVSIPARGFGAFAAAMHLLVSRLHTPHAGQIGAATRAYRRDLFQQLARQVGVSQRALFLALVAHVIMGSGTPEARRRVTSTYSTLQPGGGAHRDDFMRMRMLFARFENRADFVDFVRAVDARLAREGEESGFNAEMSAAAIGTHRRLARRLPFLYGPKVFSFMPYDFIFGLLPPHRLGGALTAGLLEPVYAGAPVPGANGCVVVPGRVHVTFNFFLEEKLLPQVGRLDVLLERLRRTDS
jgi:hypothetical protein